MNKEELQNLANSENIIATSKVCLTFEIAIPDYGQTKEEIDNLLKEWFEKYHTTIRTYGHSYRDSCLIGNSEKIRSIETFYNKKIYENNT